MKRISKEERNKLIYDQYINNPSITARQLAKEWNLTDTTVYNLLRMMKKKDVKEDKEIINEIPKELTPLNTNNYNVQIMDNISNYRVDPNTGQTTCIFGSSKRGKSTLMMRLYDNFYKPNRDIISTLFSGSPQLRIYKGDKNLLISNGFVDKSTKYIKLLKYINMKTKNFYDFLVLIDDIIDQKYSKVVNNMVLTYRNSNISLIMCLQYVFLLSKMNRANINNTFVFGANNAEDEKNNIEVLLKPYLINLGYKSYIDQVNFYKYVTKDHGFFYIDNLHNKISFHRLTI